MRRINYTDPLTELPSYERNIIRLRAFEATLILYYAEEIRDFVLDMVQTTDHSRTLRDPEFSVRVPKGGKNPVKLALQALVEDGALTEESKREIRRLIGVRNDVGHRIDHLFLDMQQSNFLGKAVDNEFRKEFGIDLIKEFNHSAVSDMRAILEKLSEVSIKKHYVTTFKMRGHLFFSSSERILVSEIKRIRKRLHIQGLQREKDSQKLIEELNAAYKILSTKSEENGFFELKTDQGRMTKAGIEFCLLLFRRGISSLAIAHIFKTKLPSITKRRAIWEHSCQSD